MNDKLDDDALMRTQDFEKVADELFEVDRTGIIIQGVMSLMVALIASIGSHLTTDLQPIAVVLVFFVTFLPNFGLKVLAEYIKKRSLVKGLQRGYTEGRKDGLLDDVQISKVYLALDSACFTHR